MHFDRIQSDRLRDDFIHVQGQNLTQTFLIYYSSVTADNKLVLFQYKYTKYKYFIPFVKYTIYYVAFCTVANCEKNSHLSSNECLLII